MDDDGDFCCVLAHPRYLEGKAMNKLLSALVAGLFAAGDVRSEAARQVVCAAADGAVAALEAISYVDHFKGGH